jgi:aminoglycoside 2''-phosphotransferase
MNTLENDILKRVHEIMPDLIIKSSELNQDGLINDVVIINKSLVFRFTKESRFDEILAAEMRILDLVRDRIKIAVPSPIVQGSDFVVYPYLQGKPLLREYILALDIHMQVHIAEQLGQFLLALHTTPVYHGSTMLVPPTTAPATRAKWIEKRRKIEERIYPLLLPHQKQWVDNLFGDALNQSDFFEFDPVLIHGDLAPYHILYNSKSNMITGIIDFGTGGIGDASIDIGNLITSYGESFVVHMQSVYPNLKKLLPVARFRAQAVELSWVLNGLETGEKFWFTAHIGNARDIE